MSSFPPALPHGPLTEVLPGFHFVTGQMKMNAMMSFDRNMTAVVHDDRVVLFNSLRLDEAGLASLDALGKVTDVVRVGAYHGRDDAFYVDRYGATLWSPEGCSRDLSPKALTEAAELSIPDAEVFTFASVKKPECIVRLPQHGGVLLPCDALQNWVAPHPQYTSFAAKLFMRPMGFFRPTAPGAGWVRAEKPEVTDWQRLLDRWDFDHLLPAHGEPVIGGAKAKYAANIPT